MTSLLSAALVRALSHKREVAIRDCVHFCGFRYGRGELNPYEQYQKGLASGLPRDEVRARFVDFLRHYRPRTLGDALGLSLSRDYPLWCLPWKSPLARLRRGAWVESPRQVVDVMTHFSARGIPAVLVELEHRWHERAFSRMSLEGYRPNAFSYARVLVLQGPTRASYLLTDGNHRISALSALGVERVMASAIRGQAVHRAHAARWPLVRLGMVALSDALAIFDVYQSGNRAPARAAMPAPLVPG
ncbi:MAG: hypothetical protein JWN48_2316 [Myxococcaceae bacterium]|nr:hypothetical protein [Myxococcaceae bacterium]